MSDNPEMKQSARVHKWDLAKAFLILMVVWGHFANEYARPDDGDVIMKAIAVWIYAFHMPLFIYLSGLFARPYGDKDRLPLKKMVYYVLVGYVLKVLIYMIKYFFGRNPVFMWFSDTGLPWYMFVMAAFVFLTWLLRKADWRLVLILSLLLSAGAGYIDEIGSFLNLSRLLVFFPYYYLGYLSRPDEIKRGLEDRRIRLLTISILLLSLIVAVFFTRDVYGSIRMFTGRNSYYRIKGMSPELMGLCRLLTYPVSLGISAGILSLIPDRPCPVLERIGRSTLQIYFWHRLVLYFMVYGGVNDWILQEFPRGWRVIYLGIATILPLILSHPVFRFPLTLVGKCQEAMISLAGHFTGSGNEKREKTG